MLSFFLSFLQVWIPTLLPSHGGGSLPSLSAIPYPAKMHPWLLLISFVLQVRIRHSFCMQPLLRGTQSQDQSTLRCHKQAHAGHVCIRKAGGSSQLLAPLSWRPLEIQMNLTDHAGFHASPVQAAGYTTMDCTFQFSPS